MAQRKTKQSNVVVGPCPIKNGTEVSVCRCPKQFLREIRHIFPGLDIDESLLALPTAQHSVMDLVNVGDDVESEKDRCLIQFMELGKSLCLEIQARGHWADYIDPCSGLPMMTPDCNKVYSEVDGMQMLLQYQVMNAGPCKVLLHPRWGGAVYPATMFTNAPEDVVLELLEDKWQ
mmetsp:Transcript_35765/g.48315  ORF Transcript_35765/g.48315 Transcript_35765/m.48315 type:complete len:175 (-) Transcript_35765:108-632(-)|eukprot:CAMPEP_0185770612 /NCGR_PEP_ID=MMETSP1174-20130828/60100_1 /TAXON_ID=35687 /ORGANISM="Dictyocha speculum, Strain CCMP1381" /LENGTH=174 /DNA_ID=CAMNT_0028456119 /DNA_START=129 /DNA_END=653 /DNA_ORIENTATION=-